MNLEIYCGQHIHFSPFFRYFILFNFFAFSGSFFSIITVDFLFLLTGALPQKKHLGRLLLAKRHINHDRSDGWCLLHHELFHSELRTMTE